MKLLTTAFAASALLALTACGGETAENSTADNAAAAENGADAAVDNAAAPAGDKPAADNATVGNEAAPAGDKPAADAAAPTEAPADGAAADKPTE